MSVTIGLKTGHHVVIVGDVHDYVRRYEAAQDADLLHAQLDSSERSPIFIRRDSVEYLTVGPSRGGN